MALFASFALKGNMAIFIPLFLHLLVSFGLD